MSITLRDMRRDIAGQMGDLLTVVADTGSSDNMVVDPVELTDFDNSFVGSQAICIESVHPENVGKVVRVRASSQYNHNIQFEPNLPYPAEVGDIFDIHNLRGRGFRIQDYNRHIATVVRKHKFSAPIPATSSEYIFDMADPFIPIPEGWIAVYGVVQKVDNLERSIHAGRYDGARGWRVAEGKTKVEISGMDRGSSHGFPHILHGYIAHPEVVNDDDLIHLNPEFVALTVQSGMAQRRGSSEWNQWAAEWARMASGARPGAVPAWPANTVYLENPSA